MVSRCVVVLRGLYARLLCRLVHIFPHLAVPWNGQLCNRVRQKQYPNQNQSDTHDSSVAQHCD